MATKKRSAPLTKEQRAYRKKFDALVKAKKKLDSKTKNPGKILTPGKWIKARAIRVHRGKLEILK